MPKRSSRKSFTMIYFLIQFQLQTCSPFYSLKKCYKYFLKIQSINSIFVRNQERNPKIYMYVCYYIYISYIWKKLDMTWIRNLKSSCLQRTWTKKAINLPTEDWKDLGIWPMQGRSEKWGWKHWDCLKVSRKNTHFLCSI